MSAPASALKILGFWECTPGYGVRDLECDDPRSSGRHALKGPFRVANTFTIPIHADYQPQLARYSSVKASWPIHGRPRSSPAIKSVTKTTTTRPEYQNPKAQQQHKSQGTMYRRRKFDGSEEAIPLLPLKKKEVSVSGVEREEFVVTLKPPPSPSPPRPAARSAEKARELLKKKARNAYWIRSFFYSFLLNMCVGGVLSR